MIRLFKVLVVLLALGFLGDFFWSHRDQVIARAQAFLGSSGHLPTTSAPAQETPVTKSPTPGASDPAIPAATPLPVPLLELTRIPLTGKTESFTTLEGERYTGIIKRVEPDGIVLRTSDGVPKLKFRNLPPEIGVKYGYDPDLELQFLNYKQAGAVAAYQELLNITNGKAPKKKSAVGDLKKKSDPTPTQP